MMAKKESTNENGLPFFSVIISVHPKYGFLLNECVHSVLNQSFTSYELLLISGIQGWRLSREEDSRIVYIYVEDDSNYCAKKNAGISAAKGRYLIFVDCDDLLSPHFFTRSHELLVNSDTDCLFFSSTRDIKELSLRYPSGVPFSIHGKDDVRRFVFSRYSKTGDSRTEGIILDSVWGKVFSSEIIKKNHIRFPKIPVRADDCLFGNQFFLHCQNIQVDRCFISYYWRPNAVSETANLFSPFYNIEGFILRLRNIISVLPADFCDGLDSYLQSLVLKQFEQLKSACASKLISCRDAAHTASIWLPKNTYAYRYLDTHEERCHILIHLRWFLLYFFFLRVRSLMRTHSRG